MMKRPSSVFLLILLAGCSSTKEFDFTPGFYEAGHQQEKALWDALGKSSVTVTLSGHAGISLPSKTGNGGDDKLSIEQLKKRLEDVSNRKQATIFEEKNFTGKNQLDQKGASLLKELGFKTVIIQIGHGQGTVIEDVIRNEPQPTGGRDEKPKPQP